MLWLKADQHQGGNVTNARYGSDAPCDPERVKLLAVHRFNHPVQFFEVQAAAAIKEKATVVTGDPEFRKVEGLVGIDWLGGKKEKDGEAKMPCEISFEDLLSDATDSRA